MIGHERRRTWFDVDFRVRPYRAADYMILPTEEELLDEAWRLWLEIEDPFRAEYVQPPAVVSVEQTP